MLDLASHDGRWTQAVLDCGAKSAVGVEARQHLVDSARKNVLGATFHCADMHDWLQANTDYYDTILCLGFLYHVYDHPRLIALMTKSKPKTVIIDTFISGQEGLACKVQKDHMGDGSIAPNDTSVAGGTYVAVPSLRVCLDLLKDHDYSVDLLDWSKIVSAKQGMEDYVNGERITMICHRIHK